MNSSNVSVASELTIPILPIQNRVLFPGGLLRLSIGRESSVQLVNDCVWDEHHQRRKHHRNKNIFIGIFTIRSDPEEEEQQEQKTPNNPNAVCQDISPAIYSIGTVARVIQIAKNEENEVGAFQFSMLVQGLARIELTTVQQREPYFIAHTLTKRNVKGNDAMQLKLLSFKLKKAVKALLDSSVASSSPTGTIAKQNGNHKLLMVKTKEMLSLLATTSPGDLADVLISNMDVDIAEKQRVLQAVDLTERLEIAREIIENQVEFINLSNKIQSHVQGRLDESRKEFFLRQQLEAIQQELGEKRTSSKRSDNGNTGNNEEELFPVSDSDSDLNELSKQLTKLCHDNVLSTAAQDLIIREYRRLCKMSSSSPESHGIRSYLEWFAELPWGKKTPDQLNVAKVKEVLAQDHYGLHQVKQRIVEYIAVCCLQTKDTNNPKSSINNSPILCLVGPPGVGKTSLAESIAKATNRKFIRISLGGVHDESEIRGHRRTYIGAMAGNILTSIKRCGVMNPLICLDEIDKCSSSSGHNKSDVSSALLEVLDANQNHLFQDHYLNTGFDLSKVMFVATANDVSMVSSPLLDRMEVISLAGYALQEKVQIARRYLWPKCVRNNGLNLNQLKLENVLTQIVQKYTREPGVRQLEQKLNAICRNVAVSIVMNDKSDDAEETVIIDEKRVDDVLRHQHFVYEDMATKQHENGIGVASGLAWTSVGGAVLMVEATDLPASSSSKLLLTGQLGDVMKESAHLAISWLKQNNFYKNNNDVHLHFPAGAVPKDGPSAGVTILTALVSLWIQKEVPSDICMTGEITLHGRVLPVGGIREKLLAAHRAGFTKVVLPKKNQKDVEQLWHNYHNFEDHDPNQQFFLEDIHIQYVSNAPELLEFVFGLSSSFLKKNKNEGKELGQQMESTLCAKDKNGPILMSHL